MRRALLVSFVTLLVCLIATPAKAHVLVMDSSKSLGLILHITPADEPVAGEVSNLYFDLQDVSVSSANRSASLTIAGDEVPTITVPVSFHNGSLSANHTFAKPGVYVMTLAISYPNKTYEFKHSQRVITTDKFATLTPENTSWAKLTLAISGSLLLTLIIVAINRRKLIDVQSK
jgi:hypothetical protein